MTQLRSTNGASDEHLPVYAACPKCGSTMKLVRIVPDKPRHEVHTARCDACGEEVNKVVRLR